MYMGNVENESKAMNYEEVMYNFLKGMVDESNNNCSKMLTLEIIKVEEKK